MKKVSFTALLFITIAAFSQSNNSAKPPNNWWLLDSADGYYGMSVEKAYNTLLKNKKPKQQIIVAVIDDGVNYNHPGLKGLVWTNKKEIAGNGIDDDHNGYVDDVHGWNFIGNPVGESMDVIREYVRLKNIFELIKDTNQAKLNPEYTYWKTVQEEKKAWFKNQEDILYDRFGSFRDCYKYEQLYWSKKLNTDSVYIWQIKNRQPDADADSITVIAHKTLLDYLPYLPSDTLNTILHASNDFEKDPRTIKDEAHEKASLQNAQIIIDHNDPGWFRKNTVHDDPYKNDNRFYGNNDPVPHSSAHHGTFCAGIIAANSNTNKYGNGIAKDVLIMPVRQYPDSGFGGDEWDKDIANCIRYAVDNGAKVVNMSFSKWHSPQKKWVDDAIKYARKKGVLLIRIAGNESSDIDKKLKYPSAYDDNNKRFDNFIIAGASTYDSALVAYFSNYGKENVDVFAPGVAIYSLAAGDSCTYSQGTSYSGPMVSGIAALIWSYYPTLTYKQVKYCIEKSATPINTLVTKPGTNEKVPFSSLSRTGGIVNAYKAILFAEEIIKKK